MDFFNSEFAQQQLSGNREILYRLLTQFIDEYQNAESDIKEMIETHNFTSAHMLIHTLKGVSGNLGLEQLHDFCKHTESLARDKRLQLCDVNELTSLIAETTKHVNQFMNEPVSDKPLVNTTQKPTVDSKTKLLEFLSKNQFIPFDKLEHLLATLTAEETDIQQLRESIQILDYEKALGIIEKI